MERVRMREFELISSKLNREVNNNNKFNNNNNKFDSLFILSSNSIEMQTAWRKMFVVAVACIATLLETHRNRTPRLSMLRIV